MTKEDYILLADRYETEDFIDNDPISLVKPYTKIRNIEISAVIAAWLSYGKRIVLMPKIASILTNEMNNKPYEYILSCEWAKYEDNYKCLSRMPSSARKKKLYDKLS